MKGNEVTLIVFGVALVALGGYDYLAGVMWGAEATLSSTIAQWGRRYPLIPFIAGMLADHLFGH